MSNGSFLNNILKTFIFSILVPAPGSCGSQTEGQKSPMKRKIKIIVLYKLLGNLTHLKVKYDILSTQNKAYCQHKSDELHPKSGVPQTCSLQPRQHDQNLY